MTGADCCPECGAPPVDGLDCWGQLGLILSWEGENPALAAQHFLTVACWNLQHPAQFTDAALDGLRAAFVAHLDEGTAVPEIRRRMGALVAGTTRVLRREPDRHPIQRLWAFNVADVCAGGNSSGAAPRVRTWAETIRAALGSPGA